MQKTKIIAEIGLLIYPDCQLSAVHGLTDLMRIAGQSMSFAEEDGVPKPEVRTSHWEASEAGLNCVWDSHPTLPHKITHALAPPSIVMPEDMQPMPFAAAWLKEQHEEGAIVGSICAGAFVLAETGLLAGRRATTHWAFADVLAHRYPQIEVAGQNMIIDDGDIITAGGILAWADLGLVLVEKLLGPTVMLATARFLLIDPPRRNQSVYEAFVPKLDHADAQVRKVQQIIHSRFAQSISIPELAEAVDLTDRTFLRRFYKATGYKPSEYLQNVRIMKARDALELTNRTVDQIAWEVGYGDTAAFRKVFAKITGVAPRFYRQRFSIAETET
ncbi:GlxA family transcriptional regulator [Brucella sp. RRSP16]|uniref:GlxA family transcriptional regulator n=1 Tax=Brucella sp. RRSP16 TaxID=3453707 RepID=UPI003FCED59B